MFGQRFRACSSRGPAWLILALSLICAGFQCDRVPAETKVAATPKPDLRLHILTNPKGYLEPCGCQQRPLGGVDRLGSLLRKERAQGVPSLLLAAGNLTFGVELRPEDAENAREQELWRAQTLIDVWNMLGMAAATPGPLDFAAGAETEQSLAARSKFPWLVENAVDADGKPLPGLQRARVLTAGAIKVGVFGVLSPSPALRLPSGAALDADLASVAKRTSEALRAQGVKLVVALVQGDRRSAREVAASGPDVVVMAGVDIEEPVPPVVNGGAVIVHAGRQGQRLLTLDLELDEKGAWRDVSAWTAAAAHSDLELKAKELQQKLRDWEKDPNVKPSDLAVQRARLVELQRGLEGGQSPSFTGRWFDAKATDIAPEVPKEKAVRSAIDAFDQRVKERNEKTRVEPVPAPAGSASYVGSDSCKSCHAEAYVWWRNTKHGHAYQTLVERNKQFDLTCVSCHVVGYMKPGGSTVTHVDNLKDVGCENCHGAGSLHNANPKTPGLMTRDTPESVCVSCHNHEHSARFVYDAFHSLLIAPGHGAPSVKAP